MMDVKSRWSFAKIHKGRGIKASQANEMLCEWMLHFGQAPENMLMDNGKEFVGREFSNAASILGCKSVFTPPYNSQSAGLIERHNGVWKVIFRKLFEENSKLIDKKLISINDIAH